MTEYRMESLRKIIATGVPRLIREDVAGEDVRNTMVDAGFGPEDQEVEELLTLGYLMAYKGLDRLAEINSDRYRCRSCGADFGLELPFPEANPTCGEETEEGSCDNGLITRPSEEPFTVWAVVTRAGGTTHGLWYYKASEARTHVQAYVAGEMPDHVALYRIKVPITVESEGRVEIFVNSVLEKDLPSGMRVTLGGFRPLDAPYNQSPVDPKTAAAMQAL